MPYDISPCLTYFTQYDTLGPSMLLHMAVFIFLISLFTSLLSLLYFTTI